MKPILNIDLNRDLSEGECMVFGEYPGQHLRLRPLVDPIPSWARTMHLYCRMYTVRTCTSENSTPWRGALMRALFGVIMVMIGGALAAPPAFAFERMSTQAVQVGTIIAVQIGVVQMVRNKIPAIIDVAKPVPVNSVDRIVVNYRPENIGLVLAGGVVIKHDRIVPIGGPRLVMGRDGCSMQYPSASGVFVGNGRKFRRSDFDFEPFHKSRSSAEILESHTKAISLLVLRGLPKEDVRAFGSNGRLRSKVGGPNSLAGGIERGDQEENPPNTDGQSSDTSQGHRPLRHSISPQEAVIRMGIAIFGSAAAMWIGSWVSWGSGRGLDNPRVRVFGGLFGGLTTAILLFVILLHPMFS